MPTTKLSSPETFVQTSRKNQEGKLYFGFYLINVAKPFADVFEALGVGDVIDQHDAHGSSVVGGGDGVEPFLTCCVPKHTTK